MSLRQPRVIFLSILSGSGRPRQYERASLLRSFSDPPSRSSFQPPPVRTSHVPEDPGTPDGTARSNKLLVCDNIRRPPLLRVNRESRSAALSFYRGQFQPYWTLSSKSGEHEAMYPTPVCRPRRINKQCAPRPLYLNPEHDYLDVKFPEYRSEGSSLCDFMRDMKNSDPKGKGLLDLIMGADGTIDGPDSFNAVAWGVCPGVAKNVIEDHSSRRFPMTKDTYMNPQFRSVLAQVRSRCWGRTRAISTRIFNTWLYRAETSRKPTSYPGDWESWASVCESALVIGVGRI